MELSYIREFVVLAETGNYLEAADALFIAQSSLSRHMKSSVKWFRTGIFAICQKDGGNTGRI